MFTKKRHKKGKIHFKTKCTKCSRNITHGFLRFDMKNDFLNITELSKWVKNILKKPLLRKASGINIRTNFAI